MLQNAASYQGLHCLPLIQQFLDKSTGGEIDVLKCKVKYGKVLQSLNIYGK